jgi:hypothetical protein
MSYVKKEDMKSTEAMLTHYRNEVHLATNSFYVWKSINNVAAEDKSYITALNRTPLSWQVITHSLQCTFFIGLGRIFDRDKDSFSIYNLLKGCTENIAEFSRPALRARKCGDEPEPKWLDEYMASTYEPSADDFVCLDAEVEKWSEIFKSIYKPLRHKIFAHKDIKYLDEAHLLFSKTNIGEIEEMLGFLHAIDRYIWELLHNGRKCDLNDFVQDEEERVRLDVKSLLESIR